MKERAKRGRKSITAVSPCLHDYDAVDPPTKELVRRAAHGLGCPTDILVESLHKPRADSIRFNILTFGPRFEESFFSEFLAEGLTSGGVKG